MTAVTGHLLYGTVHVKDETPAPSEPPATPAGETALYLGVADYGKEGVDKDHKQDFSYRFRIGEEEQVLKLPNDPAFSLQNLLKENYRYVLTREGDTVVSVTEEEGQGYTYDPPVHGTPGERTLRNFLATAMEPMGTALYIYGGGWDWQDEGSSVQSTSIGVARDWVRFFREHDETYNYKQEDPLVSYYPYGGYNEYYYAGLDCSGYLGWVLYNTFHTADGEEGYVRASTGFAKHLSELGYGSFTQSPDRFRHPGDIMSIKGHVWIALGTCSDGSIVIAHSTPSESRAGCKGGGVQLSALGSEGCAAYVLADRYMKEYFPLWYERYPVVVRDPGAYFAVEGDAGSFSWDTTGAGLTDPDGIYDMSADEALKLIFGT